MAARIAAAFSARPAGTLVVAPDNQSRTELNDAIHQALTAQGHVHNRPQHTRVLVPRQDMTGADRAQAHRYHEGDVIRYSQGSAARGVKAGDYATVERIDAEANQLTVRHAATGAAMTYDPQRLRGVSVYRESERAFAVGDSAPVRRSRITPRSSPTARENYYATSTTISSQWQGQLAQVFGLTGDVDAAQFRRLAEGHHPIVLLRLGAAAAGPRG